VGTLNSQPSTLNLLTEFISSSERWLALANPAGAINTRDAWKNHFAPWAQTAE
jgi:hypothetical protein